ncbi:MAG: hypothetical protein ACYDBJ_20535 [Aggregatilineales bacterium]
MADLIISERDAERLNDIAQREHRSIGEIVSHLIDRYVPDVSERTQTTIKAEEREVLRSLYTEARFYWQTVGDTKKLALTDAQLDEQFWCIDSDGIPRLKAEQGMISLPYDPLIHMAELAEQSAESSGRTDISAHFDELMENAIRAEGLHRAADRTG